MCPSFGPVRLSRTERDMKRVKLHPRTRNRFEYDGLPIVAKAPHRNGDSLRRSVERAVGLLGGLDRIVGRGDRVLIKPNFNCEFEIPLSTDVAFLCAVIEHLQALGAPAVGRDRPNVSFAFSASSRL